VCVRACVHAGVGEWQVYICGMVIHTYYKGMISKYIPHYLFDEWYELGLTILLQIVWPGRQHERHKLDLDHEYGDNNPAISLTLMLANKPCNQYRIIGPCLFGASLSIISTIYSAAYKNINTSLLHVLFERIIGVKTKYSWTCDKMWPLANINCTKTD